MPPTAAAYPLRNGVTRRHQIPQVQWLKLVLSRIQVQLAASEARSHRMTYTERSRSMLAASMFGMVALATPALAQSAPQCVVSGSQPAGWGFNSIGYIEIASGSSCLFTFNIDGEILSSSVSQNPAGGSLQQIDSSSFLYTSQT